MRSLSLVGRRFRMTSVLVVPLLVLSFDAATSQGGVVRVFLLGGQSNADGRAPSANLPTSPVNLQQPQADVAYYFHVENAGNALDSTLTTLRPGTSESNQFGPEIAFGRAMADHYADDPATAAVAIVKYANGGKSLYNERKGGGDSTTNGDGSEYVIFQQTVSAGAQALQEAYPFDNVQIAGMLWMQGETDATSSLWASAYHSRLSGLIDDVRATYGENLPFVIGRLSSGQTALDATNLSIVRGAQTAVADADPWTGLVDTDAFSLRSDNMHFDAAGQLALGSAFASAMQSISVAEPSSFGLLFTGGCALGLFLVHKARTRKRLSQYPRG